MSSDRSRSTDRTRNGYTGVVAQQGRVILDRDFNAQQGLSADRIAADALDFVGPCGTPDNGFQISLPAGSPPAPPFWSPPVSVQTSPPAIPGGPGDFLIAPGTMYLGGERVEFPAEQNGAAITYSYFDQPDWPAPPGTALSPSQAIRRELVYLEVTEQEVSAVEDPDLLEAALGGPDTTQRLKLLRRVRRVPVTAADCATAWKTAVGEWAAAGWQFEPATMRLLPQVSLKVGFTQDASTSDPCDPVATGGYLGPENQLIRVRIDNTGSVPQLVWGYDNASFLYRVTSVSTDLTTLTLATDPPDSFHVPQTNQMVEVVRTAAVIGSEPDETDPTGQAQILRVVAEINGSLRQLKQPYGPIPGGTTNAVVLTAALPADPSPTTLPRFMRVWQAAQPIGASGGVVPLIETQTAATGALTTTLDTGLAVTVAVPTGGTLPAGAFWQIAVRPSTPQGVYPESLLTAPQPPDGPRQWVCPLAVIDWTAQGGPSITDCRNVFDNLVTLTRRKPGCCTVAIEPGDITATVPLQTLIDRAAAIGHLGGEVVTVCLSPGTYALPSSLRLNQLHDGLTLEACGGSVVLSADPQADTTLFADGLVVLNGAQDVTLHGLTITPPRVPPPSSPPAQPTIASPARSLPVRATIPTLAPPPTVGVVADLVTRAKNDGFSQAAEVLASPITSFGVRAFNAPRLTLEDCSIQLELAEIERRSPVRTADTFAAAVFVQGNCSALTMRRCTMGSGFGLTYSTFTVSPSVAPPKALDTLNRLLTVHTNIPSSLPLSSPPPSPPTSPPVSRAALLDTRISGALDLVVAKRLAVGTITPSFAIVTVGLLAADSLGFVCELDDAVIRDSQFARFTFATWFSATTTSLRLQDNTVSGGVAGFWLEVPGVEDPPRPALNTDVYYDPTLQFEEHQLLVALASAFPPVGAPSPPSGSPPSQGGTAPSSLIVTGNQIDTRVGNTSTGGSAALMLALYTQLAATTTTMFSSSVIVSANRLCGGMFGRQLYPALSPSTTPVDPAVPAAVLTMPNHFPCSITGNVILNGAATNPADASAPSLWLTVADIEDGTELLSISGNVLVGLSDLALLNRLGRTADNWTLFNANPT